MNSSNNRFIKILGRIDLLAGTFMRTICLVCLTSLLILLSGNVFFRFVPIMSMGWYDEIVELLFAWLVFIGAAALWRDNSHFRVDWLYSKVENRTIGSVLGIFIESASFFFLWVMAYQGLRLTLLANDWTPILKLPKRIQYVVIPLAGAVMIIYSIRNIVRHTTALKASPTESVSE